jgi:3'-phosphoadenosine 5'-phosphosulfate sulfotransferase (PAPS reductase)/FAD synthetase
MPATLTTVTPDEFLADPAAHLADADVAVPMHSGGKDSTIMTWEVWQQAQAAGVADRVVVMHNDLGRVEWPSTAELDAVHGDHYRKTFGATMVELLGDRPSARGIAERQAAALGAPFVVYSRNGGDLLQQIEQYGKFPDADNRHCTSDQKRGPKHRFFTAITRERALGRKMRILEINGERADESTARKRKSAFEHNRVASNKTKRDVWTWRAIHTLTELDVWDLHDAAGLEYHWAYDAGMTRLSCSLCVLGSLADVTLACLLRPDLAQEYLDLEQRIGHTFKYNKATPDKGSIGWYRDRAVQMVKDRAASGESLLQSRPEMVRATACGIH